MKSFGVLGFGTLTSCCPDGRSSASVERLCLKGSCIGIFAHFAAEGVKLVDKMAFCKTSYGWIAWHTGDGGDCGRDKKGVGTHPGGRKSSLDTGMATTDNHNLIG